MPNVRPVVVKDARADRVGNYDGGSGNKRKDSMIFQGRASDFNSMSPSFVLSVFSFDGKRDLHGMSGGNFQMDWSILTEMT